MSDQEHVFEYNVFADGSKHVKILAANGAALKAAVDDFDGHFPGFFKGGSGQIVTKPTAQSEAEPKNKKQPCTVVGCSKDLFWRNEKNGKSWYSHKGQDGSYHNLKS